MTLNFHNQNQHEKALHELEQKMQQGTAVSDSEIMQALGKIRVMTNTWHAAFLIATYIAPVCGYRPHLAKQLLPRMLDPLTMSGVTNAQQVVQWIDRNLAVPNPFYEMSQVGIDWLQWLTNHPATIQEVLDELIEQDRQHDLEQRWQAFKAVIQIPRERVEFRTSWDNGLLSEIPKGIVFIQISVFGDDEESDRIGGRNLQLLETLTDNLAKHDPDAKLRFLFFTWEAYGDLVTHFEKTDAPEVFGTISPEKVQVLWMLHGKSLHLLGVDDTDFQIIEAYTQDLLGQ